MITGAPCPRFGSPGRNPELFGQKKCGIDSTRRAVSAMYRVDSSRDRNHIEPATTTDFEGFRALSALWSILAFFFTRLRNTNRDPECLGRKMCANAITFLAVSGLYRVDFTKHTLSGGIGPPGWKTANGTLWAC